MPVYTSAGLLAPALPLDNDNVSNIDRLRGKDHVMDESASLRRCWDLAAARTPTIRNEKGETRV